MRDQLKSLTTRTRNAARKAGNWLREAGHAAGYIIRIGVTKGDRADKLILTLFAVMTIVNLIVAIITPSMNTWGNVLGSIAFWLLYVLLSFHTFHTYKFAEELERYQGIFRRITDAAEERGGKATFNVTIHDVETFIGLARKRDDEKATESTESTPETV